MVVGGNVVMGTRTGLGGLDEIGVFSSWMIFFLVMCFFIFFCNLIGNYKINNKLGYFIICF